MMNISIIGHIGNDAEIKDFGSNQAIIFNVAVTEKFTKNGEQQSVTTWFQCTRWTNNTSLAPYLKKGGLVYVSGKPNNRAWIDKDGIAQIGNGITVNEIKLLGDKQNG